MLLRFQRAAGRGNYETGNQAFSKCLRFLTIRLAYEAIRASGLDLALTLVTDRQSTVAARSQVFDAVIRSRALVFDELAARHRSAYGGGDPEAASLTVHLFSARNPLAPLAGGG